MLRFLTWVFEWMGWVTFSEFIMEMLSFQLLQEMQLRFGEVIRWLIVCAAMGTEGASLRQKQDEKLSSEDEGGHSSQ